MSKTVCEVGVIYRDGKAFYNDGRTARELVEGAEVIFGIEDGVRFEVGGRKSLRDKALLPSGAASGEVNEN